MSDKKLKPVSKPVKPTKKPVEPELTTTDEKNDGGLNPIVRPPNPPKI